MPNKKPIEKQKIIKRNTLISTTKLNGKKSKLIFIISLFTIEKKIINSISRKIKIVFTTSKTLFIHLIVESYLIK